MKKGFTLIELLAVIVILAVIALITIPAVMKMIDNSTNNSYRRSIDLYGKAVSNAIIEYKTDMVEKGQATNITFDNIESYIEYEGNEVDCKIKQIYSDKTILLAKCYVQEELVLAEKNRGYGEENYYYYSNLIKKIKIIKYIEAVEDALQGRNISGTCEVEENGNITCNGENIEINSKLEKPISGTLIIENGKVVSYSLKFATEKKTETNQEIPQVIDEQNTSNESNNTNNNNNHTQENIQVEDYRGYYADVDGDGTVDGIIYADLAHDFSGSWCPYSTLYWNYGTYSYTKRNNLNEYTVSNNTYKKNDGFGENKIIKLKEDKGNPRFYVMALEDFREGSFEEGQGYTVGAYYWYKNGYDSSIDNGRMTTYATDTSTDFGKGYANTGKIIEIWNKNGTGEGSYTGATQDDHDIFKYIQSEYAKGWYIPSRGEWAAFADYFSSKEGNKLTHNYESGSYVENSGNYNSLYGLSNWYWSSSQRNSYIVWFTYFGNGYMGYDYAIHDNFVRLGITF